MSFADPVVASIVSKGRLLALDPGTKHPAIASFLDGKLVRADRVKVPACVAKMGRLERCRTIANLVVDRAMKFSDGNVYAHFVAEMPQIYNRRSSKGDPNKLMLLALVVAAVAGEMDITSYDYLPAEWIGGIPKSTKAGDAWTSPRGAIIKSRLRDEWTLCADNNDAVDACGIGLKIIGRLDRSIFPGAT